MNVRKFLNILGSDFYTGVPDSQLKPLINFLMGTYGIDPHHHIIAANEGNCVALAAGYHLATGKIPVVYMQNSGEGNIINPVASLLNDRVYAIPMIFVVGWRGEPGVYDEPQHIYQGKITQRLLSDMDIKSSVIGKETTEEEVECVMQEYRKILEKGKDVAFIIRKDAFLTETEIEYKNNYKMIREEVIHHIVRVTGENPIISTTGKISRELFETRAFNRQSHKFDFLTVGSMGHCSSIALGVALNKPQKKIWCIDGDGAALMHMGALAVIGSISPQNLVHILINNGAHETVGGMPTAGERIDFVAITKACGYPYAVSVNNYEDLDQELEDAKERKLLTMIEVKCSIESRENLGRPTLTTIENKNNFMRYLDE